ncbi:DUF1385 domain-containing protein [Candidatus Woesearchaeota archaeon]|nr:MAG: DUF1385 domain-containing protein [Candidatus Woesearchaeota archaeon]
MRFTKALAVAAQHAPFLIGGQAVMEGVMMKSKHHLATAVRKQDGSISVRERKEESILDKYPFLRIPFVRGAIVLFETLIIGLRELNWSASEAYDEEEKLSTWELTLTMVLAILFALALFKLLPLFLANLITTRTSSGNLVLNLLDGGIKLLIFVGYLLIIGQFKDMKRLFAYHGAEHKSVNCYEAGAKLTPRNAKKFTRLQARCGTTFVIYVIALSIVIYLFIPFGSSFWEKYLLRIALLPVVAGVAYEWVRFSGKRYKDHAWVRFLSAPGMAFQRITTREPDLKQLAVAITALEKVIKREEKDAAK